MNTKVVKLNVGGRVFMSTYSTLAQSSLLKEILSCDYEGKEIFIDRSPSKFKHLLQYMRTGDDDDLLLCDIRELNYFMMKHPEANETFPAWVEADAPIGHIKICKSSWSTRGQYLLQVDGKFLPQMDNNDLWYNTIYKILGRAGYSATAAMNGDTTHNVIFEKKR